MKQIIYILTGISLVIGLSACEMHDELKGKNTLSEDEGLISLDLLAQDYSHIITRGAFPDEEVNVENYMIQIIDVSTENVVKESTYSELKADGGTVKLTAGKYRVKAYNYEGEHVGASTRPYFKGQTEFQILPGKTTTVNTTCRLSCLEVNLSLDKSFGENFKDNYAIIITNGSTGNYAFSKENVGKKVYFNVPESASSILMSVKVTTIDGTDIAQTYTITKPENSENNNQLENGDSFKITVNPGDDPVIDPVTKINLGITVDLTWVETGTTIEIPTDNIVFNPGGGGTDPDPEQPEDQDLTITGVDPVNFSAAAVMEDQTKIPNVVVNLQAKKGIKNLVVEISSTLGSFGDIINSMGLASFDLLNLTEQQLEVLGVDGGLGIYNPADWVTERTSFDFVLTNFMALLANSEIGCGPGEYYFKMTLTDTANNSIDKILTVTVGN